MVQELTIDLRLPPKERWKLTPEQVSQGRELVRSYNDDLRLPATAVEYIVREAGRYVAAEYWAEMEGLAYGLDIPLQNVVVSNLYYDALKSVLGNVFGCTAFGVETFNGILHGRNLDWWTENSALSRYTAACRFVGGDAGEFTGEYWIKLPG